jgi:actin-binding LIM protein
MGSVVVVVEGAVDVLQRHLSDAEFEAILQVGRQDFYRLPQWRRNELKRRARLF